MKSRGRWTKGPVAATARSVWWFKNRAIGLVAVWSVLAAAMLTACGDDGNGGGNEDTLLTGLSGVIIFGAVIWFVLRKVKSRR